MRKAKRVEVAAWAAGWTAVIGICGGLTAATARALQPERRPAPPWAIDWLDVTTPEPVPRGWRDAGDPRRGRTALVLLAIERSTSTGPVRTADVLGRYDALRQEEEPVSRESFEETIERLLRDGLVTRRRGRGLRLTGLGRRVLAEAARDGVVPAVRAPDEEDASSSEDGNR